MNDIEIPNDTLIDGHSRLERYWSAEYLQKLYNNVVNGEKLPKSFNINNATIQGISEKYSLRGVQFGNWLTVEDKFNYLAALHISLNDLNKVLGFTGDMGFGLLGVSFGARGSSSARAHFESSTLVINLTRYWRNDVYKKYQEAFGQMPFDTPKKYRFVHTGGMGSFAHEYGHFLDYVVGRYIEPANYSNWLTGGYRSTNHKKIKYSYKLPIRNAMEKIMQSIMFNPDGSPSRYKESIKSSGDYINRRLEIFARVFEQYIFYKLRKKNIKNVFLSQPKYRGLFYLSRTELESIVPKMDVLMKLIAKKINSHNSKK